MAPRPTLTRLSEGTRVLITGGLGFIGSTLAHRLLDLGLCPVIIDSLIPEQGGTLFNVSDIRDRIEVVGGDWSCVGDGGEMEPGDPGALRQREGGHALSHKKASARRLSHGVGQV